MSSARGSRKHKLGSSLRGGLSRVIQTEMKDPRLGFVTVTGVDVSPDLRMARVFVSILGDDEARRNTLDALHQARGFLRRRLGETLALRRIPELRFQLDTSADQGERIDRLLRSLHGDTPAGSSPGDGGDTPAEGDPGAGDDAGD